MAITTPLSPKQGYFLLRASKVVLFIANSYYYDKYLNDATERPPIKLAAFLFTHFFFEIITNTMALWRFSSTDLNNRYTFGYLRQHWSNSNESLAWAYAIETIMKTCWAVVLTDTLYKDITKKHQALPLKTTIGFLFSYLCLSVIGTALQTATGDYHYRFSPAPP